MACRSFRKSWVFLVSFLLFLDGSHSQGTACTARETSFSYLDIAIDMIRKGKDNFPQCTTNIARALDCGDLLKSGQKKSKVYTIWPQNRVMEGASINVYCDMETDGGGWTVIQRRGNFSRSKDYFYQDWSSYKKGFGDLVQDFWLGNDKIFALSNQKLYTIRFDLKDLEGAKRFATYDTFWIDDEDHKYAIHIKGYKGDAGDSMAGHDGRKFSAKDQDNDDDAKNNCSQLYKGGWWYNACHSANLNGLYLRGKHDSYADGVNWHSWKGHHESMDTTEIKIREKDFQPKMEDSPAEPEIPSITPQ